MAVQRPIKTAGTRQYQTEFSLGQQFAKDVEVDADFDTIYNAWNNEIPDSVAAVIGTPIWADDGTSVRLVAPRFLAGNISALYIEEPNAGNISLSRSTLPPSNGQPISNITFSAWDGAEAYPGCAIRCLRGQGYQSGGPHDTSVIFEHDGFVALSVSSQGVVSGRGVQVGLGAPVIGTVQFDGTHFQGFNGAWVNLDEVAGVGANAGGDLTGTYPNPTVTAAAKSKWMDTGTILTPTLAAYTNKLTLDNTGALTVTGGLVSPGGGTTLPYALVMGTTVKAQWNSINTDFSVAWNIDQVTGIHQDTSKPGWFTRFGGSGGVDKFSISRAPAGGGAQTPANLFTLDSGGHIIQHTPGTLISSTVGVDPAGGAYWRANDHWAPDLTGSPSWAIAFDCPTDRMMVQRRAPAAAAGTITNVMVMGSGGDLVITGATATKASGTTWANPSDDRVKTDVGPYTTGLAAIEALNPISYTYNGKGGSIAGVSGIGFSAQAVQSVMPEMVRRYMANLEPEATEQTELLALDTTALQIALVNAVKELTARVAALETPGPGEVR